MRTLVRGARGAVLLGAALSWAQTPAHAAAPSAPAGPSIEAPVPDASPARAPTPTTRSLQAALQVRPGATCLSAEMLADHVRLWLGSDEIAVGVSVEVDGDPTRLSAAVITVRTPAGVIERPFDQGPPGCSDLHAVIGLAIAMAIDASVLATLGYEVIEAPAAPQAVDNERPPMLTRREAQAPAPAPASRSGRLRAYASFRGGLWLGMVPGIAGGGQLHIELGWREWFELRAGVLGGYGGRRPLGAGTVELGLVAGRLDACFGLQRRRLRPRLCVGSAAGAFQAMGRGFEAATDAVSPWVGGALAVELRVVTTRVFAVDITLDAVIPFLKPVVAVRDPDKPGMIGDAVNFAPVGVVLGLGGAFTIR